jgi:hypothetical protein
VLDWAHRLVLDEVRQGDAEESPALENLVAAGLVARVGDAYEVTDAGRAALDASEPSRLEAWSWRVLAAAGVVLAVGVVVGWLTG